MTAEIAIINKLAIALAADSAVTIETHRGNKIFNTVNKLFTLSKHQPVAVMVYGGAQILDVPWEIIIKLYRRRLVRCTPLSRQKLGLLKVLSLPGVFVFTSENKKPVGPVGNVGKSRCFLR
ncbi:MAG: hypothetical protein LAP85_09040, partial [Acidobacteriia bacterium]|nr:hypothetical protein [Terriglobia bacterium]